MNYQQLALMPTDAGSNSRANILLPIDANLVPQIRLVKTKDRIVGFELTNTEDDKDEFDGWIWMKDMVQLIDDR